MIGEVSGLVNKLIELSGKYGSSVRMMKQMDPKAMSTLTKQTSVEPFCVISKDCVNLEYMTDVNNTLLNMFIAYYLQAVASLVNLKDVRTKKILRALSTDVNFSFESHSLSEDLLKFKLPTKANLSLENNKSYTQLGEELPDLQAAANLAVGKIIEIELVIPDEHIYMTKTKSGIEKEDSLSSGTSTKTGSTSSNSYDYTNNQGANTQSGSDKHGIPVYDSNVKHTSTGSESSKVNTSSGVNVDNTNNVNTGSRSKTSTGEEQQIVTNNGRTIIIPILVKLLVNVVSTRVIEGLLVRHKEDTSLVERIHSWRAGRISFWRDLIMCQDLIKERKKNALSDENGVIAGIDSRVTNAIIKKSISISTKAVSGKNIDEIDAYSLGVASNLYVITSTEASKIEFFLNGKLSDNRIRQKLFGNGYAMILAVIDPDRERVKFYVNGADGYTDLSVREIKSMSKNKGPDISDMLKMLQMGMSPTF